MCLEFINLYQCLYISYNEFIYQLIVAKLIKYEPVNDKLTLCDGLSTYETKNVRNNDASGVCAYFKL